MNALRSTAKPVPSVAEAPGTHSRTASSSQGDQCPLALPMVPLLRRTHYQTQSLECTRTGTRFTATMRFGIASITSATNYMPTKWPHVRTESDGKHPAVREVEVRGWDPTKNLEDIVDVIYEDRRSDGLPLLRLKLLKKTHVKRSRKETIARLQFKRVEDCFHMVGRYHKMDTYHAFAANGRFSVGQPIPGSAKYAGSWTLSSAGPDIALR